MTQPYGQQPDPSGGYPQSGGFPQGQGYPQAPGYAPTPPGGYPQSPPGGFQQGYPQTPPGGYPPAPGYGGGMPPAPQEYGHGPMRRPSSVTAAAVLGFVQAGITTIPAVIQLVAAAGGSSDVGGGAMAEGLLVSVAELIAVALLITGGVQLIGGRSRNIMIAGAALELVICLYWLIRYATLDSNGIDIIDAGKGVIMAFAIFFAVMPTIILAMSLGGTTTQFLQSRRGH